MKNIVKQRREKDNVVERAIAQLGDSPVELARRLSEYAGEEITRQRVNGWRMRGIFPRTMLIHVERLTNISLNELTTAEPKKRDEGNIVLRAIRLLGEGSTAGTLAAELSKATGKRITRQMVNGWTLVEQFQVEYAAHVHVLTKIPVKDLIDLKGGRLGKKKTA